MTLVQVAERVADAAISARVSRAAVGRGCGGGHRCSGGQSANGAVEAGQTVTLELSAKLVAEATI